MKEIEEFLAKQSYPSFDLKAVFFDMDGVLFDSMPFHALAWTRTMQNNGFDFTEYDAYMNEGRTGESTINEFFLRHRGRVATDEECKAMYAEKGRYFEACGPVKPVKHVLELLHKIEPWQAVVIENAPLGIQAGVGAGIFTIGVNTGILEDKVLLDAGAHVVYPSMHELLTQWTTIYD